MNLKLRIWRQEGPSRPGSMKTYELKGVPADISFLEMLDMLNEELSARNEEPVAFDHDCREGICGMCSMVIDGVPHGPEKATTTCQLHMRHFKDGDTITVEPWRAKPFPVVKDLVVDRSAFDRIIEAGGYVSVNTGNAVDGNSVPVNKIDADAAFDAATCIGCGACVAACPNGSAMLFVAAKVNHLARLPQGQPERMLRVTAMVEQMDHEDFGHCTNHYECGEACPKEISVENIARMNCDYLRGALGRTEAKAQGGDG